MDNFSDSDINLFCSDYNQHIASNPLLNSKIPVWVEYLKTKQHYRQNGMDEDYFFRKRFGVTDDDLVLIHKLIDRVKRGKTLTKVSKSNIMGTQQVIGSELYTPQESYSNSNYDSGNNIYSSFNENINYDETKPKFELMNEISSAMDAYNKKMKKHQNRHKWKQ